MCLPVRRAVRISSRVRRGISVPFVAVVVGASGLSMGPDFGGVDIERSVSLGNRPNRFCTYSFRKLNYTRHH
jgi:hypothetical protein